MHLFSHTQLPSVRSQNLLNVSAILEDPDVSFTSIPWPAVKHFLLKVLSVDEQFQLLRYPRYSFPTDPKWPQQWVLVSYSTLN